MLGIIGDLLYAFLIHLILVIIIFFIDRKRRKCVREHYKSRKRIIRGLLEGIKYWHSISVGDTDVAEKNLHHSLATEYLKILTNIASDEEIREKSGTNMEIIWDKINYKN